MYNRYIPQSDGSYQRNWIQDNAQQKQPMRHKQNAPIREKESPQLPAPKNVLRPEPVGNFLQQLLPKNFDTGDLIIVLLLLLLAGDCEEDRNTALLTLALYILM